MLSHRYLPTFRTNGSNGSSVGVDSRIRDGRQKDSGSIYGAGKKFYSTSTSALWLTEPPITWVHVGVSQVIKEQRRDVNHSPPSSAEVSNGGVLRGLPCSYSGGSD
jgi:hypothetical protein